MEVEKALELLELEEDQLFDDPILLQKNWKLKSFQTHPDRNRNENAMQQANIFVLIF